ncbi:helix-hairpin-helix domain-containing protein [Veillonella criceti]|uniref:ComE operon protein 1 n=1 Tax=Veillonella criceti TaxID=103891 RepID=A0A380NID1_9FIRM|nr:helix-hairpin-helix domain-containing protein [Veillonella criceti]SUP41239.1 ComE operon protein 1 [Veillonella criceti]
MEQLKKYKKLWLCLGIACMVYLLVLRPIITDSEAQMNSTHGVMVTEESQTKGPNIQTEENTEDKKNMNGDNEYVYVTGAVETPGLYKLQGGQTVGDVIQACGGLLPYASVDTINLAEVAASGSHIHVAFNFMGNPEELLRKQKININTANEQELTKLSGVGPGTAKKIIAYREQSGLFKTIEDIKKVKGIGEATFKKLAPHITV